MSKLITINDIMLIAEYKLYIHMKLYKIENIYHCFETEEYDNLIINLSNKLNCKINYPLKASYNKNRFKEMIKDGYIVNNIQSRLLTNELYNDFELKSIIENKENINLYVYNYNSYNSYIIQIPEIFKKFNFTEIILDKENCNKIILQNLPNNMKKLCINFNSIDVRFQRRINEILHTYRNDYTLLNEPIEYINEIDYNILSPSGNLKYIELPDIIIHHNKLINIPEDVIIKTYSYQLYIFDFWANYEYYNY
jgi:hypothetical protein